MFIVSKNGKEVARYPSKAECAAFIFTQGWFDPIERYGMVWKKGVEILPCSEQ